LLLLGFSSLGESLNHIITLMRRDVPVTDVHKINTLNSYMHL